METAIAKARHTRLLTFKSAQITILRQQLNGYRTASKKSTQRIHDLEEQLRTTRASSANDAFETPGDRIFADLQRNKDQPPSARRYSLDTLTWAREILSESPAAYRTIRKMLPLPSECCLREKFMNSQLRIRQALTDIDDINLLIEIWREANGIAAASDSIPAILAVDAVAFRPTITINDNGTVQGLEGIDHLDAPDIFSQFALNPTAFRDFITQHFDRAYSSLFVYQIQPLDPKLTCCVIHATAAINGKGNESTVTML
jgi:hypothetical protein